MTSTLPAARMRPVHQPRYRRDCLGELIQIDGSEHWWFEGRGPRCTLLVYIDDATSRLMHLQFVESESTFDYFAATSAYLERYGKPVAFYSDKHGVFRVNRKDAIGGDGMTQFGRALHALNRRALPPRHPRRHALSSQDSSREPCLALPLALALALATSFDQRPMNFRLPWRYRSSRPAANFFRTLRDATLHLAGAKDGVPRPAPASAPVDVAGFRQVDRNTAGNAPQRHDAMKATLT